MSHRFRAWTRAGAGLVIASAALFGCEDEDNQSTECPAGTTCESVPNESQGGSGGQVASGGQAGSGGSTPTAGNAASSGGSSGSPTGDAGSGGSDEVPAGEPCSADDEPRCAGDAQTVVLECRNGLLEAVECERGYLCDRETDACAPVIRDCAPLEPGDAYCNGNTRVVCGPDLVSVTEEECEAECTNGRCRSQDCGDGEISGLEACDDGNDDDDDECLSDCTLAKCGDGVVHEGVEECDDGNKVETDDCRSSCLAAICGDGVTWKGKESCDDANDVDDDACPSNCQQPSCGDGYLVKNIEDCEDGNQEGGDGCSPGCRAEPVALSLGSRHSCAILSDHRLKCWGSNDNGILGFGNAGSDVRIGDGADEMGPDLPVVLENVAQVAAGSNFTCAVDLDGQVWCWGSNSHGQLGRESDVESSVDPAVADLGGEVASICAGMAYACARLVSGDVKCWGDNTYGQLALDRDVAGHSLGRKSGQMGENLAPIPLGAPVTELACGDRFACAMLERRLFCWGLAGNGTLGPAEDTFTHELQELPINGETNDFDVRRLALGSQHGCGWNPDGSTLCWGSNAYDQLGMDHDQSFGDDEEDFDNWVRSSITSAGTDTHALVARGNLTCALTEKGIQCIGDGAYGALAHSEIVEFEAADSTSAVSVAVGSHHVCAILEDGSVHCWGDNSSGQLGNESVEPAVCDDADELPVLAKVN